MKMNRRSLALMVVPLAACSDGLTVPTPETIGPDFSLIQVDDGDNHYRPVASNVPARANIWTSLAQSFTAEDPTVRFAFGMIDLTGASDVGRTVIYNLYEGENSYTTLLASRSVSVPPGLPEAPGYPDLGFVEADFTDVVLVPGQRYTVEATVPLEALPVEGETTSFGIWTSLSDPYDGGRFFFPSGYYNGYFAQQDMFLRVTPVPPVEALGTQIQALVDAGVLTRGQGNALTTKLDRAQALASGGKTGPARGVLTALIHQVEGLVKAGKLSAAEGQSLIDLVGLIRDSLAPSGVTIALVANQGSHDLSFIDVAAHPVTNTIPVGQWPRSVATTTIHP